MSWAALQQLAQALHVPSSALPTLGAELQRTAWLGKYVAPAGLGALSVIAAVVASGGRAAPARPAATPVPAAVAPAPTPALEAASSASLAAVSPAAVSRIDVAPAEPARPKITARARTPPLARRRSRSAALRRAVIR